MHPGRPGKTILLLAAAALASGADTADAPPSATDPEGTVRAFVKTFNAHDVEGMLALVTDDVEWLSVDGRQVAAETEGKEALARSMKGYFEACPSCRSELESVVGSGSRVATVERAHWQSSGEARSQASLAVYELRGDRIRRVYYFAAE